MWAHNPTTNTNWSATSQTPTLFYAPKTKQHNYLNSLKSTTKHYPTPTLAVRPLQTAAIANPPATPTLSRTPTNTKTPHPLSSIPHPLSSIPYPLSPILYPLSSIPNPQSPMPPKIAFPYPHPLPIPTDPFPRDYPQPLPNHPTQYPQINQSTRAKPQVHQSRSR